MGRIRPTEEQQAAVDMAATGATFVLDAPAGSGKSSTAVEMAERINGNALYLVYNKAAKEDAEGKFPGNTTISTTAALAWHAYKGLYGDRMKPRQAPRVPATMTAKLAGITKPLSVGENLAFPPFQIARWAMEAIERFCYSADPIITNAHVPESSFPLGLEQFQIDYMRNEIRAWAQKIWGQAIDPKSKHKFTMDYAFKLLIHTEPQLGYDTVIVDEAQDSNMATHQLVSSQASQLIVVGDPAQQIYGWRGAVDIMGKFEGPRLQLTQSFRFGQEIAEEAEKWLAHTGTNIHIKGLPNLPCQVMDYGMENPDAILCRTNASAMSNAITYLKQNKDVAVVGGTEALQKLAFAAIALRKGETTDHPELVAFSSWDELVSFTEEPSGGDLKPLVQLIHQYGTHDIIDACNKLVPETPAEARMKRRRYITPDVVISTAHKAKGREWMNVKVSDDFKEPDPVTDSITGEERPGDISRSEAMLHYVTVTRARAALDRGSLAFVDQYEKAGAVTDAVPMLKKADAVPPPKKADTVLAPESFDWSLSIAQA